MPQYYSVSQSVGRRRPSPKPCEADEAVKAVKVLGLSRSMKKKKMAEDTPSVSQAKECDDDVVQWATTQYLRDIDAMLGVSWPRLVRMKGGSRVQELVGVCASPPDKFGVGIPARNSALIVRVLPLRLGKDIVPVLAEHHELYVDTIPSNENGTLDDSVLYPNRRVCSLLQGQQGTAGTYESMTESTVQFLTLETVKSLYARKHRDNQMTTVEKLMEQFEIHTGDKPHAQECYDLSTSHQQGVDVGNAAFSATGAPWIIPDCERYTRESNWVSMSSDFRAGQGKSVFPTAFRRALMTRDHQEIKLWAYAFANHLKWLPDGLWSYDMADLSPLFQAQVFWRQSMLAVLCGPDYFLPTVPRRVIEDKFPSTIARTSGSNSSNSGE